MTAIQNNWVLSNISHRILKILKNACSYLNLWLLIADLGISAHFSTEGLFWISRGDPYIYFSKNKHICGDPPHCIQLPPMLDCKKEVPSIEINEDRSANRFSSQNQLASPLALWERVYSGGFVQDALRASIRPTALQTLNALHTLLSPSLWCSLKLVFL